MGARAEPTPPAPITRILMTPESIGGLNGRSAADGRAEKREPAPLSGGRSFAAVDRERLPLDAHESVPTGSSTTEVASGPTVQEVTTATAEEAVATAPAEQVVVPGTAPERVGSGPTP